jgi:hypothetical protein
LGLKVSEVTGPVGAEEPGPINLLSVQGLFINCKEEKEGVAIVLCQGIRVRE